MPPEYPIALEIEPGRLRVGHRLAELIEAWEERRNRRNRQDVRKVAMLGLVEKLSL
jgi:hypothetical protein